MQKGQKKSTSKTRSFREQVCLNPSASSSQKKLHKNNSRNIFEKQAKTMSNIHERLHQQKLGRQKDFVLRVALENK